MTRTNMRWALGVGFLSVVLIGIGGLVLRTLEVSECYAAERGEKLLDINSASEQELKDLPGIGDALASRIIKNRPYTRKDELVDKKVIPEAAYERIKNQIVARRK